MSTCACARFSLRNMPVGEVSDRPTWNRPCAIRFARNASESSTSTTAPIIGPVTVPMPPMMQISTTCTEISMPNTACGSMKPT